MGLKIAPDHVVKIAYRLLDTNGNVLEERTPENPYEYMQGRGQIVAPVEHRINGQTAGFRVEVTVTPREGYGEYDPSLVVDLPKNQFPKEVELNVGMRFNTTGPNGRPITVRVIEVADQVVTVDGNHPLAGIELIFEVRVLDVRAASEDEIHAGRPTAPPLKPGSSSLH